MKAFKERLLKNGTVSNDNSGMLKKIKEMTFTPLIFKKKTSLLNLKNYLLNLGQPIFMNLMIILAPSSEFVSSSIPSWQILTAHAQPFRGVRDLVLKVPLDSLLVWASSEGSGETARMRRLAWTFAARIGDKYQIRLTRSIFLKHRSHRQGHRAANLFATDFIATDWRSLRRLQLLHVHMWNKGMIANGFYNLSAIDWRLIGMWNKVMSTDGFCNLSATDWQLISNC